VEVNGVDVKVHRNLMFAKVPIGRHGSEYEAGRMRAVVAAAAARTLAIAKLDAHQIEYQLLKHCGGTCLVTHLMRALPPDFLCGIGGSENFLAPLDAAVDTILRRFTSEEIGTYERGWMAQKVTEGVRAFPSPRPSPPPPPWVVWRRLRTPSTRTPSRS
jgi:hypothetical protein